MGFSTILKAQKALKLLRKGESDQALTLYRECWQEGLTDPRSILAYVLLLLRGGEYTEAKEVIVKSQKYPGMVGDTKQQLHIDYAVCCFRLGDIDKAVTTLEHRVKDGCGGLMYGTLGYLYVEKYDRTRKPSVEAFLAMEAAQAEKAAAEADEAVQFPDVTALLREQNGEPAPEEEPAPADPRSDEERLNDWWQAQVDVAKKFLDEAIEYDDEDSVCLDNMAQFYYRVLGDKATAKEWFERAVKQKKDQIDTLWFLSRYDVENGDKAAAIEKLETIVDLRYSPLNYITKEAVEQELARLRA